MLKKTLVLMFNKLGKFEESKKSFGIFFCYGFLVFFPVALFFVVFLATYVQETGWVCCLVNQQCCSMN
jgi:hypothetical protein